MLERFLDQLSPYQQSLLRHFTIYVFENFFCCENNESYRGWITVCAQLPPSLKSVTFDLALEIIVVKKVAEFMEVLSKRIVRSAPRIQIAMTGVDNTDDYGRRDLLKVDYDLLKDALGGGVVMKRSGGGGLDSQCGK